MRKPRDFDSALRALTDKTKTLKENKRRQLGELIVATGADAFDDAVRQRCLHEKPRGVGRH